MTNSASELRKAMKLVHELSGDMVGCYDLDIGDFDWPDDDEMDEQFERILEDPPLKLWFPGEDNYVEWDITDFLRQSAECDSISVGKLVSLRTRNLSIQLVVPVSEMAQGLAYHNETIRVETTSQVTVQLQPRCLPVAVYATKEGAYGDHLGPVSLYTVVEADFSRFRGERTEEYERNIIDAYLFELAASHDAAFSRGQFTYDFGEPWWVEQKPEIKLRPLQGANEGVRLFLAASQVEDPELRFLSFYKVLEHYGPTVLNFEAHESLRKKLDSPAALAPDGRFIREVLQLSKSFDPRKSDRDLIRGVLTKSVDVIGLNNMIPESFRRVVTHNSPAKEMEAYTRAIAECLCATRNQVAHAKAAYVSHGTECAAEELEEFTGFLRAAAAEAVRWYNRLPDHQRIEFSPDLACEAD